MSGMDIGLYGILTKAILLTTDTVSMLVVVHIRTRLKPFGGIIANVLSTAYTTGLAVSICNGILMSSVFAIIPATFL